MITLHKSMFYASDDCKKRDDLDRLLAISDGLLMRRRPSPSDGQNYRSDDLLRARLDQIIRSDHRLVRLADAMPWDGIVEQVAEMLPPTPEGAGRASRQVRMIAHCQTTCRLDFVSS